MALEELDSAQLVSFVQAASEELDADFACMTALTLPEITRGIANSTTFVFPCPPRVEFAISSLHLEHCLPDLYWLTILGRRFVRFIGQDRVCSTPGYRVEHRENTVLIQLTADLRDLVLDWERFAVSKEQAKHHLGEELFFAAGR